MKICPTCQTEFDDAVDFCPNDGMKLRLGRGPAVADPMLGRNLDGRWIIEKKIGEGGMGAVYLGHQRSVQRRVAIKTLHTSLNDNDSFVDRFFREAKIATTINHPHCVTILDFGQDPDGTLYLAMEYLEGLTLSARLTKGDLTLEEILKIGIQIASALSAAHDASIVHRDLKPDNIFVLEMSGGGTFVKVLDFGIAKVINSQTQVTQTGQIFGTPHYMSPEQCQGQAIDGRSDLYSLGCILYELIGGRPPFGGDTPMAILMAHIFGEVESLSAKAHGVVPVEVEELVVRLLQKSSADRYASATEVREALESALAGLRPHELKSMPLRDIDGGSIGLAETAAVAFVAPEVSNATPSAQVDAAQRKQADADDSFDALLSPAPSSGLKKVALALVVLLVSASAAAYWIHTESREPALTERPVVYPEPVGADEPLLAEALAEIDAGGQADAELAEVDRAIAVEDAPKEAAPRPAAASSKPAKTEAKPAPTVTTSEQKPADAPRDELSLREATIEARAAARRAKAARESLEKAAEAFPKRKKRLRDDDPMGDFFKD
ncbi:MAG: serine/threonine protein kinase [Bradymonadaceae bacterium]|nr:serine/threonine protein kinase [Lujinxingiaceae bacterium]